MFDFISNFMNMISNIKGFEGRILSIFIFFFVLFIFSILISNTNNIKKIKRYFIFYFISLVIMASLFNPTDKLDLYRLITIDVDFMKNISAIAFLKNLPTRINFTTYTLMFIASRINFNGFLPAFASSIYYSVVLYIIYDYSKKNKMIGKTISKCLIFFMVTGQFGEVISGIRCMTALAIFAFSIYQEIYNKKSIINHVFLYFLAIGLHSASIPVFLVRIVFLLFQKEYNYSKKFFNFILLLLITLLLFKYGGIIVQDSFIKANNYISNGIFYSFWEHFGTTIALLIFIFMIYISRFKNKVDVDVNSIYNNKSYKTIFLMYFMIVVVFSFIEFNIFNRFSRLVFILSLPYILEYFNYIEKFRKSHKILKCELLYYVLFILLFIIEISRAGLNYINFFKF